MKLPDLDSWRDFLEMLREQGATQARVTCADDGEVIGLVCDLRRVTKTGEANPRPATDDEPTRAVPLPAGLGGML